MNNFIPVNEPLLDGNEKKYLNECIDSGWISSEGPFVERFESNFADKVDRQYAIAVANGSVAIDTALAALKIGVGDEVIMPTFTIISCATAVIRAGATPVLVDCDAQSWNMLATEIEAKINSRTKAIMLVHIYGLPVDVNPILKLAEKHQLAIIEDAAEMHGQTYYDKPCGSFGDISTFSFYPNKHVTTGEGGMVVTNDEQIAERCRSLRNLCFQASKRFIHEEMGWNFRMSNLQAAVGLAQLERLDEFVQRKRAMGLKYTELLQDIELLQLPLAETEYAENIYWVYGVVLDKNAGIKAKQIMQKLANAGIGTRPFFWPMHQQPVFNERGLFTGESHPVAEHLATHGFYLPSGMALTESQVEHVATTVQKIFA